MRLQNPTSKTIYALLGNEHGAQGKDIFVPPGSSITVTLTSGQAMNFKELEPKLRDLGLVITP